MLSECEWLWAVIDFGGDAYFQPFDWFDLRSFAKFFMRPWVLNPDYLDMHCSSATTGEW